MSTTLPLGRGDPDAADNAPPATPTSGAAAFRPSAIAERLVAPAPAERLAALRILVGAYATIYLVVRLPHLLAELRLPAYRWAPVGPFEALHLPPADPLVVAGVLTTLAAGVAFTSGWHWRVSGPLFALGALATFGYGLSWGHILHTEHLMVLQLLVLAASPAADALSLDARAGRRIGRRPDGDAGRYGFPVRLVMLVTVLTYAIAGWMKLRNGGGDWLSGDVLRNQVAYDNLRKVVLGDRWSWLGGALVATDWIWRPIAIATVAVELSAPLALWWRRFRLPWAVAAWLFHVGTLALMAIMFPYPLSGIAFASLFPLERGVAWLRRRWAARGQTEGIDEVGQISDSVLHPGAASPA